MTASREGFVFVAAEAAAAKTAAETVVLEVGALLSITDHFVVTSGRNDRQVRAIVEEVERRVREAGGGRPKGVEGIADARWVLLDYGDFVVHVFDEQARAFYALERLWADVPRVLAAGGRQELLSAGA